MNPEKNPLVNIEDRAASMDFGKQGFHIYQGAIEEGATPNEALRIVTAFYAGMFRGLTDDPKKEEDERS